MSETNGFRWEGAVLRAGHNRVAEIGRAGRGAWEVKTIFNETILCANPTRAREVAENVTRRCIESMAAAIAPSPETEQLRARVAELERELAADRTEIMAALNMAPEWKWVRPIVVGAIAASDARERGVAAEGLKALYRAHAAERRVAELEAALRGFLEWREEIAADLRQHTNPEPLFANADAALSGATPALDTAIAAAIRARGESLSTNPEPAAKPLRHAVNEHGDCAHWCSACRIESRARGES